MNSSSFSFRDGDFALNTSNISINPAYMAIAIFVLLIIIFVVFRYCLKYFSKQFIESSQSAIQCRDHGEKIMAKVVSCRHKHNSTHSENQYEYSILQDRLKNNEIPINSIKFSYNFTIDGKYYEGGSSLYPEDGESLSYNQIKTGDEIIVFYDRLNPSQNFWENDRKLSNDMENMLSLMKKQYQKKARLSTDSKDYTINER